MTTFEILERWAQYTKFDPEQTRFNLLTSEYTLNRCNKRIQELLSNYDPSGTLAVVYAKNICRELLQEKKLTLFEALTELDKYQETKEIWEMFSSQEVRDIEDVYLNAVDKLVQQVTGTKMLGQRDTDTERDAFFASVDAVVEELHIGVGGCNEELYRRGGEFKPVGKFSTHIHVFQRLADCLISLESVADGIYLCYIAEHGSAAGYFGFYLKSNGNLLSVNERVNEAFAGEHKQSRNARWTDEKKYRLFPYSFIMQFSEHDYKGYATKHIIDEDKLSFMELGSDAYMPLILAMVMLNQKYAGRVLDDLPLIYVDSLMPVNLKYIESGSQALMIPSDSAIALSHQEFQLDFTPEKVLDGSLADRYNIDSPGAARKPPRHTGHFSNRNQMMVDMYGQGFQFNVNTLLRANQYLELPGRKEDDLPNSEFVGDQARMELQAYYAVRKELAEYMRDRIHEEYVAYGGVETIKKWWRAVLKKNAETIDRLAIQKFVGLPKDPDTPVCQENTSDNPLLRRITYCKGDFPSGNDIGYDQILNYGEGKWYSKTYYCPVTNAKASHFFVFKLADWMEMEALIGEEVPRILKGWRLAGHDYTGNQLLYPCDEVDAVGTPFEKYQSQNWRYYDKDARIDRYSYGPAYFNFAFAVGYSKSGLNKLQKQYLA